MCVVEEFEKVSVLRSFHWGKARLGFGTLRSFVRRMVCLHAQIDLAREKSAQRETFCELRKGFRSTYAKMQGYDTSDFVTPFWVEQNDKLEAVFLPEPPFAFLRDPIVAYNMFVNAGGKWLREELTYLRRMMPDDRLRFLLAEDYAGDPQLINVRYTTSHNTIHHLYHLVHYFQTVKCPIDQVNSIIEWGGGYGNLAKIFLRLKGSPCTYTIIDTPLISCLQWVYLATVLGTDRVHLINQPGQTFVENVINILPLCFLQDKQPQGELFISTWALSESTLFAQEFVANREWFGAPHLLLAYQDSWSRLPEAKHIGDLAARHGAIVQPIPFLAENWYAFR